MLHKYLTTYEVKYHTDTIVQKICRKMGDWDKSIIGDKISYPADFSLLDALSVRAKSLYEVDVVPTALWLIIGEQLEKESSFITLKELQRPFLQELLLRADNDKILTFLKTDECRKLITQGK